MRKICPRCGSDRVEWVVPQMWSRWICYDCGYQGPVIEGDENLAKEIRDDFIKSLEESEEELIVNKKKVNKKRN